MAEPDVERKPGALGGRLAVGGDVDAGAAAERVERGFHRVALRDPLPVFECRVARRAPPRGQREIAQRTAAAGRCTRDLAGGIVAVALHGDRTVGHPDLDDRHFVSGESSGLVGADERGRAERFHGFEMPYECAALCHPLGAHGKREGDGGQQALWDNGHGDADSKQETVGGRCAEQQRDREERNAHRDGDGRDDSGQPVQLASKRSRCRSLRLSEFRYVGKSGASPGSDDRGLSCAPSTTKHPP